MIFLIPPAYYRPLPASGGGEGVDIFADSIKAKDITPPPRLSLDFIWESRPENEIESWGLLMAAKNTWNILKDAITNIVYEERPCTMYEKWFQWKSKCGHRLRIVKYFDESAAVLENISWFLLSRYMWVAFLFAHIIMQLRAEMEEEEEDPRWLIFEQQ